METRMIIYADEGKVLTNGEIYGTQIFLGNGISKENFYEISQAQYEKILAEQEEKINDI